jgi:ligand-binding SRPBCC domain-containing protein
MKICELNQTQILPIKLSEAWEFFSNPVNLNQITPAWLKFKLLTPEVEKMYSGQILKYKITTLFRIPQTWITEIKSVSENKMFIDEQRFGPYKFWHHKHIFKEIENGVEMTDLVHYVLPFGVLGRLVHKFYVRGRLQNIFQYRYNYLETQFGKIK